MFCIEFGQVLFEGIYSKILKKSKEEGKDNIFIIVIWQILVYFLKVCEYRIIVVMYGKIMGGKGDCCKGKI